MVPIKIASTVYLVILVISSMSLANEISNLVKISSKWFRDHGCPKQGNFLVECNQCTCFHSRAQLAICELAMCNAIVNDNYKDGDYCKPDKEFFSNCSICKCNKNGTGAECDDKICKEYYSDVLE